MLTVYTEVIWRNRCQKFSSRRKYDWTLNQLKQCTNTMQITALTLSYFATIAALSDAACANNTLSSTLKLCSVNNIVF